MRVKKVLKVWDIDVEIKNVPKEGGGIPLLLRELLKIWV